MKGCILKLLLLLVLLLSLLCLKKSMFEYFSNQSDNNTHKLNKIIKKFEKKYKLNHIRTECSRELNNLVNSKSSRDKVYDIIKNGDMASLVLIDSPKEIVELRDCVMKSF